MSIFKLQEIFKINGVPEHTFVRPKEYTQLSVALDTPGRNIIIEGPSGIGKTSAITQAMKDVGLDDSIFEVLSARKTKDTARIRDVANGDFDFAIIDDFHRLEKTIKEQLANLIKTMADDEVADKKLILIGISDAGKSLINLADDIVNRVEVISFETNSDHKIDELITLGEEKLNISFNTKEEIIESSNGSFFLAQLLCYHCCIEAEQIQQEIGDKKLIEISFETIKYKVFSQLSKKFHDRTVLFCQGGKLRPEGRAPYLNILYHFSKAPEWTLDLRQLIRQESELKGSISQVVSKGYLVDLYNKNESIQEVIYYDVDGTKLTVQDPQYIYYLRNIKWHTFAREVGFTTLEFPKKYDFALSFSGSERDIAEQLFDSLTNRDVAVFYDKNEQHRIIANDVKEYLGPIYNSESEFIVVLLSTQYPRKIWTQFESDAYNKRIGSTVIPIMIDGFTQSFTDTMSEIGHLSYSRSLPCTEQINGIAENICKRLVEHRESASSSQ
ncbi:TIR domain-containing protein [Aeromonas jandaei]|uniref:TIR domain-containing protein n=1 Tax=Aeromonas jandaei TaxID=650 RepID=UPI003EC6FFE0